MLRILNSSINVVVIAGIFKIFIISFYKRGDCSAYNDYKFLSLFDFQMLSKKAAQLLALNETVVCELWAVCCMHEGISTVATAEALNSSKAPDLTYGTFAKGGLLRN